MQTCKHANGQTETNRNKQTNGRTEKQTYIHNHTYTYTYVHTYIRTYVHTFIIHLSTYTYIYIYTYWFTRCMRLKRRSKKWQHDPWLFRSKGKRKEDNTSQKNNNNQPHSSLPEVKSTITTSRRAKPLGISQRGPWTRWRCHELQNGWMMMNGMCPYSYASMHAYIYIYILCVCEMSLVPFRRFESLHITSRPSLDASWDDLPQTLEEYPPLDGLYRCTRNIQPFWLLG